jgi:hypothetical protein
MESQQKLKKHAALFDEMATHLGIDLEAAFERGEALTLDELGEAVLRCANCSDPAHCAGWLGARTEPRAPSYCQNLDLLSRLKGG